MVLYSAFNSISVISWRQLTLFMSFLGFTITRFGLWSVLPKDNPTNNPEDPVWLEPRTPALRVKHFSTEPSRNMFWNGMPTLPSIYILILTHWRKKLWEKTVENDEIAQMSNFTFFHNVFYAICILESVKSHISVVVCSSFEFGTVSKWCIREWVKLWCLMFISLNQNLFWWSKLALNKRCRHLRLHVNFFFFFGGGGGG